MSAEIGIFPGKHVDKHVIPKSIEELKQAGFTPIILKRNSPALTDDMIAVMAIGGDGTVRKGAQALVDTQRNVPLCIMPNGTNNVTFHDVCKTGLVIHLSDLHDRLTDGQEIGLRVYPGMTNNIVFTVDAIFGCCGRMLPEYNKKLRRHVPSSVRRPFSAALTLWHALRSMHSDELLLDLYTISGFFGHNKLFPDQNINDENITNLRIDSGNLRRLAMLGLGMIALGLGIPQMLEQIPWEQKHMFETNYSVTDFSANGSRLTQPQNTVKIYRSASPIHIVAVSPNPSC